MKKLNELIKCEYDINISGVVQDSREVKDGYLFVAIKGFFADRFDYIDKAIENGAVAVVADRKPNYDTDIPIIIVEHVNQVYLDILSKFYDHVEEKLNYIATTGTDGKTTTSTIIKELMNHFIPTAYMGSNGLWFKETITSISNNTPEAAELYQHIESLVKNGCKVLSMELSSEGLMHGRADNLRLDYAVLTNISEDHLNIHGTMENYISSKAKIFDLLKENGKAILNRDDRSYELVVNKIQNEVYTYGVDKESDFCIENVNLQNRFTTFTIVYKNQKYNFKSPYFGMYNVYNVTAAISVLLLEGYPIDKIKEYVEKLKVIPGRCEFLDFGQDYSIILDYAHTANGINNILEAVHEYHFNRIITVTGSAGGREKEKRVHMGKTALEKSDLVIFTMDDPRHETVDSIIDDLISGSDLTNYERINDRKEAIHYALSIAKKNDLVLVIGKGRDPYMAIGDEKVPYCDYDVIKDYFN